ncbi:hypothetical protein C8A03DRAFT_32959 [Achaetomium macrosporum]|uniref:Uncharacterized protein n=1 Tax=Achaetomium macrosporum TaxID=79813 RepID=A0AAN7CCU1_9PEZI|nr:hypothetical protein C8A03DRAFT_32959 [Achaetomium macrosporum]
MMFKTTTILALVAALAPSALAVPAASASKIEARQVPANCPRNVNVCGFTLIDRNPRCAEPDTLIRLGGDGWNSIYHVNGEGVADRFVRQCAVGQCVTFGADPKFPEAHCRA